MKSAISITIAFKLQLLIMLVTLIASCGVEEKEKEPTFVSDTGDHALAVSDKKDIGECTEDNLKQLVYVISEKQFYTCEGKGWTEINIKFENKIEYSGEDSVFTAAFWKDKVTGKTWFVHPELAGTRQNCPLNDPNTSAGFKPYDKNEALDALRNGFFHGINVRVFVDPNDAAKYVYSDYPDVEYSMISGIGSPAFSICLVK
jgi:hypothetical protein